LLSSLTGNMYLTSSAGNATAQPLVQGLSGGHGRGQF
jgi:hypothetical protein